MWLLPFFSFLAFLTARIFYRLTVVGDAIPSEGPVLLVANHPNSLADPMLVMASAGRPVRFLAKATLFTDAKVGWMVRRSGAIPLYRRHDDPTAMGQNEDTFRAIREELANGSAVGIFPEGISHSQPSITQIKTGAARIALGTAQHTGALATIIPVGLVPDAKEQFRSKMLVVLGRPIAWDDLATRGTEDREAVRELTRRIEGGLRRVTLNLEKWEDRLAVQGAVDVWTSMAGLDRDRVRHIAQMGLTTRILEEVRKKGDPEGLAIIQDLKAHLKRLHLLGLRASDLGARADWTTGVRWAFRRIYLVGMPVAAIALAGWAAYLVPFYLTRTLTRMANPDEDRTSTYKLLIGILAYMLWTVVVVGVVAAGSGWTAAAITLVGLPFLAWVGLQLRERWRGALRDMRRFFTLRLRKGFVTELREAQVGLAKRLDAVWRRWEESA